MGRLYTIKHGKGYIKTGDSYRSNLVIVNKDTLLHVAQRLGVNGVAKSHSKEKMAEAISAFVLSHPEECLQLFSVKELLVLKDFVDEGPDTCIARPNRKFYNSLRELLFVSTYHDKKSRSLHFLLPDELRELFAPLLDKQLKETRKREKLEKAEMASNSLAQTTKVEEPEYLEDDDIYDDWDTEDDYDEDYYKEEIVGISHRHYDSLYDFLNRSPQHDWFDSVLAVQDFHQNANVVESRNAVITIYASVVYANQQYEKVLFRSKDPIEVRIDTKDLNNITIPDLPSNCVSKYSTQKEVMHYSFGVLTIEGYDENHYPFVVSLI